MTQSMTGMESMSDSTPTDPLARALYDAAEKWLQNNPGAAIQAAADAIRFEIACQISRLLALRVHCEFHNYYQADCELCAAAQPSQVTTSPDGQETGRWVQGFPDDRGEKR